jgi:hypothetical protein
MNSDAKHDPNSQAATGTDCQNERQCGTGGSDTAHLNAKRTQSSVSAWTYLQKCGHDPSRDIPTMIVLQLMENYAAARIRNA